MLGDRTGFHEILRDRTRYSGRSTRVAPALFPPAIAFVARPRVPPPPFPLSTGFSRSEEIVRDSVRFAIRPPLFQFCSPPPSHSVKNKSFFFSVKQQTVFPRFSAFVFRHTRMHARGHARRRARTRAQARTHRRCQTRSGRGAAATPPGSAIYYIILYILYYIVSIYINI